MKKGFSKVLALVLSFSLVLQAGVPAFATTGNVSQVSSDVVTEFSSDLPDDLYAGVKYNIQAITKNGASTNIQYNWKVLVDGVEEANRLQVGTTGVNDQGNPYQYVTVSFPESYAGKAVTISAEYGTSVASKSFTLKKPITDVSIYGETDTNSQTYYDASTNTLYADQSFAFEKTYVENGKSFKEKYDLSTAGMRVSYDSNAQDRLGLVATTGVNAGISQYNGVGNISVLMTDKAPLSGGSISLEPLSGYKASHKINLVKGLPATDVVFTAKGGYFVEGLDVARIVMKKNPDLTLKVDLDEIEATFAEVDNAVKASHPYVHDGDKCVSSGFMMVAGEYINIDAKIKAPAKSNDTFAYELYHSNGSFIKKLATNDNGGCVVQINDPGSYVVKVKAVSVGNGVLRRAAQSSFNVLVKEANPVTGFVTKVDSLDLSNKVFTVNGKTYQTGGNLNDYITVSPSDYTDILEYSSDNTSLVVIDEKGDFSVPLNTEGGTTKLWVKSRITGLAKSITVNVIPGTVSMSIQDTQYSRLPGGHSEALNLKVNPTNSRETVKWVSSSPSILTVDPNGVVKANVNYKGEPVNVTVTATSASGVTAQKQIIVVEEVPTASSTLSLSSLTDKPVYDKGNSVYDVYAGNSVKLTYDTKSSDGKATTDVVEWGLAEGSLEDFFTVVEKGENFIVLKSNTNESVKVRAYALRAGESVSQAKDMKEVTLNTLVPAKAISGLKDVSMYVGNTLDVAVKLTPSNSKLACTDNIVFSSDNANVANVTVKDGKYVLESNGAGTANITCYACYDASNPEETKSINGVTFKVTVLDRISLNSEQISVSALKSLVYNGKEQKQAVKVYDGKTALKENKDYTLAYSNMVNVGKASIEIKGMGNYQGTIVVQYDITPASISKQTLNVDAAGCVYTGGELKPAVTIKGLEEGKDFVVSYRDNINVGNGVAIVTGIGNYTDVKEKTFKISKAGLVEANVELSSTAMSYTGKALTPSVKVAGLVEGTDYDVTYSNNTKVGKATVTVVGKGNYTGKVVKDFYIQLPKPVIKVSTSAKSGKPVVSWKAVDGADKYMVYRATSKNGSYKRVYTTTKMSYTNTKAEVGNKYYYKVKAVYSKDTNLNSYYSSAKYVTCDCARPVVKATLKNGKPKLSWKKVTGAKSYVVYRATTKKGTYKKVATTKNLYYVNKTAKKNKTYYYKVKAVCKKTTNGNSAYSTVVSKKATR